MRVGVIGVGHLGRHHARLLGGVMIDPLNVAFHSTSAGYLTLFALAALFFLASTLVLIPLPNRK